MFINITGPDCCGKTMQVTRLAERLRPNVEVLALHIPSKARLAGYAARMLLQRGAPQISDDPLLVPILRQSAIITDRYAALPQIKDTLRHGGVVIVDRWKTCGEIYGVVDGLDVDWIRAAQDALPDPDLSIFIDVPPEEIDRRLVARGRAPECYENTAFQKRIVTRYRSEWLRSAVIQGPSKWQTVAGTQLPERVHDDIYEIVKGELTARQAIG